MTGMLDFVMRKEPRREKVPPYVVRAQIVIKQTFDARGYGKSYEALTDVCESFEEVEGAIKALSAELYNLRIKAKRAFEALERAEKKAQETP